MVWTCFGMLEIRTVNIEHPCSEVFGEADDNDLRDAALLPCAAMQWQKWLVHSGNLLPLSDDLRQKQNRMLQRLRLLDRQLASSRNLLPTSKQVQLLQFPNTRATTGSSSVGLR